MVKDTLITLITPQFTLYFSIDKIRFQEVKYYHVKQFINPKIDYITIHPIFQQSPNSGSTKRQGELWCNKPYDLEIASHDNLGERSQALNKPWYSCGGRIPKLLQGQDDHRGVPSYDQLVSYYLNLISLIRSTQLEPLLHYSMLFLILRVTLGSSVVYGRTTIILGNLFMVGNNLF